MLAMLLPMISAKRDGHARHRDDFDMSLISKLAVALVVVSSASGAGRGQPSCRRFRLVKLYTTAARRRLPRRCCWLVGGGSGLDGLCSWAEPTQRDRLQTGVHASSPVLVLPCGCKSHPRETPTNADNLDRSLLVRHTRSCLQRPRRCGAKQRLSVRRTRCRGRDTPGAGHVAAVCCCTSVR